MAVDRARRNEFAGQLAAYLRGEVSTETYIRSVDALLNQNSSRVLHGQVVTTHGFSVNTDSPSDYAFDTALDVGMYHAHSRFISRAHLKREKECRQFLINLLILMRSDMDEDALEVHRISTVTPHAVLKMGCVAFATFFASLFLLAFLESPFPLLLWPIIGVCMFVASRRLVKPPEEFDDAIYPFKDISRMEAASSLVPQAEMNSFITKFPLGETSEKPLLWWQKLISVIFVPFSVLLTITTVAIAATFTVVLWPYVIYDTIRRAQKAQKQTVETK